MKFLQFALTALILTLGGCAYPTSSIEQGAAQSNLRLINAPIGAQVLVDGRKVGERTKTRADDFPVSAGHHLVEIMVGESVNSKREYFVGAGSIVEIGVER